MKAACKALKVGYTRLYYLIGEQHRFHESHARWLAAKPKKK